MTSVEGSGRRQGDYREKAREGIVNLVGIGEIRPEERLSELKIAGLLGVSRTPVREALATLAHDGIIRVKAQSGLWISRVLAPEMRELLEVSQYFEAKAVDALTEQGHNRDFLETGGDIFSRLAQMEAAQLMSRFTQDEILKADAELHTSIAERVGQVHGSNVIALSGLKRRIFAVENPMSPQALTQFVNSNARFTNDLLQARNYSDGRWAVDGYYSTQLGIVDRSSKQEEPSPTTIAESQPSSALTGIAHLAKKLEQDEPSHETAQGLLAADEIEQLILRSGTGQQLKVRVHYLASNPNSAVWPEANDQTRVGWTYYQDGQGPLVLYYRDPRIRGAVHGILPLNDSAPGQFARQNCLFELLTDDEVTPEEELDIQLVEESEAQSRLRAMQEELRSRLSQLTS